LVLGISENRFFSQEVGFEDVDILDNGFEDDVFEIPGDDELFILAMILSTDAFTGISS